MTAVMVGCGAVTPLGLSAPATAAAHRAGISAHAEHPFMLDRHGDAILVAAVPWGEEDMDGVARMVELAVPAAWQALGDDVADEPVDVLLALPEPRPGLPGGYARQVGDSLAAILAERVPIESIEIVPGGPSAGLTLVKEAAEHFARGSSRPILIGGVDTWLVPETLEWLDAIEALHSPTMPWGFCPGEAAAFCKLANPRRIAGRLAVVSVGNAVEQNRIRTETVCIGAGLTAAWRSALRPLESSAHRVSRVWCDLNSEPYRGDEIAFAVTRTREHLSDDVDFVSPADCWGDVGAATGPLLFILAETAAVKGYAPGPLALVSTSSDGGGRAAVLLYDRATGATTR